MSADSHHRGSRPATSGAASGTIMLGGGSVDSGGSSGSSASGVVRCIPTIVPPQAVSDRSIIDSVAGFISDVTLQAQTPPGDIKDHIIWVRFESTADISDPSVGDDWELEGGIAPPLLLILGYVTGVQVWVVAANGEAIEVLSWRHGSVKCLRVLPTPAVELADGGGLVATQVLDPHAHKRPLMALCESGGAGAAIPPYSSLNFVSLKDGETVRSIKFKSPIVDVLANRASIVVTFAERIAVFDARTLEDRLTVTTCHPSPGLNPNPVALGPRWIAYAERRLIPSKRSSGGCEGDGVTSYTATVLNAAKSLGKGLRELGEQVAAGLTGSHLGSSLGTGSAAGTGGIGGGGGVAVGGSGGGLSAGLGSSGSGGVMGSGSGGHGFIADGGVTGGSVGSGSISIDASQQAGVVTVLDIKHPIRDVSPTTGTPIACNGNDPIVAHFVAHSEALVALTFDAPGMLLLTADRRGHDFHVFRLQPHPSGSSLAAVHHLYILHRGDTTAKVQDVSFSLDSRWVAVSTLRGTTHVFPVTPYGGPAGVRTHGSPHVVNRLSRFHRSAGLSIDARSSSPISHAGGGGLGTHHLMTATAYANPRTPPFPNPTIVQPLAQLRQPASLTTHPHHGGHLAVGGTGKGGGNGHGHTGRQRNSSSSSADDPAVKPLRVCATFAKGRSWLLDAPGATMRDTPAHRIQRKSLDSLFILAAHGALIQYDLDPKHVSGTPREKICDDTPIELEVEAKAQWCLQRQGTAYSNEIQPPLPVDNWLIKDRLLDGGTTSGASGGENCGSSSLEYPAYDRIYHSSGSLGNETKQQQHESAGSIQMTDHVDDRWLSQVEIITHAGPHRRLWMGPQFMFKTYNTPSGSPLSSIDTDAVEVSLAVGSTGAGPGVAACGTIYSRPARSNPMNMPLAGGMRQQFFDVICETGTNYEQSPRIMNMNEFRHHENLDTEFSSLGPIESQLREDLADAMRESPLTTSRDATGYSSAPAATCVHQQQYHHPHLQQQHQQQMSSSSNHSLASTHTTTTGLSSVSSCSSTSIYSSTHSLSSICDQQIQIHHQYQLQQQQQQQHCSTNKLCGGASVGGPCRAVPTVVTDTATGYFEDKLRQQQGGNGNQQKGAVALHHHCRQQQQESARTVSSGTSCRNMIIAKVVNPLGTVTTVSTMTAAASTVGATGPESIESDELMQECDEAYLYENCDEALFRPVVTVHATGAAVHVVESRTSDSRLRGSSLDRIARVDDYVGFDGDYDKRSISQSTSLIGRDLIVPVIEEEHLSHTSHVISNTTAIGDKQPMARVKRTVTTAPKPESHIDACDEIDTAKLTIDGKRGTAVACVLEEFVNVEFPAEPREPLSKTDKSDIKEPPPKGTDAKVKSAKRTSVPSFGEEEKLLTTTTGGALFERKGKREGISGGGLTKHGEEKHRSVTVCTGSRKAAHPAVVVPKEKRCRDQRIFGLLPVEQDEAVAGITCAIALPPLEALKIDDNELFGEDNDSELSACQPKCRRSWTGVRNRQQPKPPPTSSSLSLREAPSANLSTADNDEFHDFSTKNEIVDFAPALLPLRTTDTTVASPPAEQEAHTRESTLISFESPLQERDILLLDEREQLQLTDERNQVSDQMQNILHGGNILLAMCSSLHKASSSSEQPFSHRQSTAIKEVLTEGQDSDYKSLELETDVMLSEVNGRSALLGLEPNGGSGCINLVVANRPAATGSDVEDIAEEDDQEEAEKEDYEDDDVTINSNNEPEEEAVEATTTITASDCGGITNKRIRKRGGARAAVSSPLIHDHIGEDGEKEDEDGEEAADDDEEEEDEELQPLISGNKTFSSSLSATTCAKALVSDSVFSAQSLAGSTTLPGNQTTCGVLSSSNASVQPDVVNNRSDAVALYALPTVEGTVASKIKITTAVTTVSGGGIQQQLASRQSSSTCGGATCSGTGNGNGKSKKSKKKRK
ncbi:uncharacterized protein LOC131213937 [Anopheles bellator]|uniref:uncharacterized protein LOC131213937 n=1 Tax=Anopheles bellator TaxID=139047 RepID=UPI0026492FFB|nr:uncharacterized protein LOC131213937 [Anopheles bellator]